ncbi:streptophobe family protein [Streptomyces sp. B1-3]|uniref:streptophobe family protein n=1 Tax=Streptomyces sp. B1-3 TaxID=3141453 RepID=UPI003D2711FF
MSAVTVEPKSGRSPQAEPARPESPLENALEGAAAALCALIAMVAVSALALWLLDAGSFGSMWSLALMVTAMAVGGAVSPAATASGAESSGGLSGLLGGGGLSPSMSGTVDAVPLGVTLLGALVLWLVFSWRMRGRRFTTTEVAGRTAGAAVVALFGFLIVAKLAEGSFRMPASTMSGLRGEDSASEGFGSGNSPLGGLFGGELGERLGGGLGLGGGSRASQDMVMNYQVQAGSAVLGGVLWVAVVIALGCLITRRAHLPMPWQTSRLRVAWAPSVSAVTRMLLLMTVVPLIAVVFVGVVAGGTGATAAGAALLLAPDTVVVVVTLGLGASWTASTHQTQSEGGNPLVSLLRSLGGSQPQARPDRVEQLRDLSAGGWPLWLLALLMTGLALLACGYLAARGTALAQAHPRSGHRTRCGQHLVLAGRLGIVLGVTLGLTTWLAQSTGQISATMFGSEMGGTRAELGGSVPLAALLGLLAGGAAGFVGSLLHGLYGGKTHRFHMIPNRAPVAPVGEHHADVTGAAAPGVVSGPLETSLGNR